MSQALNGAILAQVLSQDQIVPVALSIRLCGRWLRLQLGGMFPAVDAARQMQTLDAIHQFYSMDPTVWAAFTSRAGDPGNDLRLLASLPPPAVAAACEVASLPDGRPLTAIQAAHVGLVYRLCRRVLHLREGGNWETWEDVDPWQSVPTTPTRETRSTGSSPGTSERKMKLSSILDQSDDTEFQVLPENMRARWLQQYIDTMGGPPEEECEPTGEQVSALFRKIYELQGLPYCDFGIFVPYGRKQLRASKFRAHILTSSGYVMKEIQHRTCQLRYVESELPGVQDLHDHAGHHKRSEPLAIRSLHRTIGSHLPYGLALSGHGGRQWKGRAHGETEDKAANFHSCWRCSSLEMGPIATMGYSTQDADGGRAVLERSSSYSSDSMDGSGRKRYTKITSGEIVPQLHEGWSGSDYASAGKENSKRFTREEEEEETPVRQGGQQLPEGKRWRIPRRRRKIQRKGQKWKRGSTVLRLERQHRQLRRIGTGSRMQSSGEKGPQVHEVQESRTPSFRVPYEEVMGWLCTMAGSGETRDKEAEDRGGRGGDEGKKDNRKQRNKGCAEEKDKRNRERRKHQSALRSMPSPMRSTWTRGSSLSSITSQDRETPWARL